MACRLSWLGCAAAVVLENRRGESYYLRAPDGWEALPVCWMPLFFFNSFSPVAPF